MKTLTEAAIEFEGTWGPVDALGAPQRMIWARVAFMAGAAAMAEQFAHAQGPLLNKLEEIRQELERIANHGA
jgi:hypothetical protein